MTTIDTTVRVRVGRSGTKVHQLPLRVEWQPAYADRAARVAVYGSRTICGSQRFGSGVQIVGLDTPVTCQKCHWNETDSDTTYGDGRRFIRVSDPTRVVTTDRRGTLVPTDWAVLQVTPEEQS